MAIPDGAYDFVLDGKGYILARNSRGVGGRAWQEVALAGSTARRTQTETQYGTLPTTVEAPMVWQTWHAGYGDLVQRREGRYYYADNMDARIPEQIAPGPKVNALTVGCTASIVRILEFGGVILVFGGNYCKRISSDDQVEMDRDFGGMATVVDACIYNGYLYVSFGCGGEYIWRRDEDGIWTQSSDTKLGYMAVWKERLWAQKSTTVDTVTTYNGVQNCAADPLTDANWTSNGPIVGDPGTAITRLGAMGGMLYVGKTDGLHGVDASEIAPLLTPELRAYPHVYNCYGMTAWHGMWFVPHLRGLLTYRDLGESGFLLADASPGRETDDLSPVRGIITAMAGDDHWLYAALYNSEQAVSYIIAGRAALGQQELETGNMVWHPLARLVGTQCMAMHLCGLYTNPRLVFGHDADVDYITLPRSGDNPVSDSNCRYATSGSLYLSAHSWEAPATIKVWRGVRVQAANLSTARYLTIYYSLDGGPWRQLGLVNVSPVHTLSFPPGGVSGADIRLRIDYTGTDTVPLTIRSVVVIGAERPSLVRQFSAAIRCATGVVMRNGGRCPRTAKDIREELYTLAEADRAVLLCDPLGDESYVLVQPGIQMSEAEQEARLDREMTLTVQMTEFYGAPTESLTGEFAIYGTSTYGGGHIYA